MRTETEEMREMFLADAEELLASLEVVLMDCEDKAHADASAIRELFRLIHTLKGSCSMMGLKPLSEISHKLEDLLSYVRENPEQADVQLHRDMLNVIFAYSKYIHSQCRLLERGDGQPTADSALLDKILDMGSRLRGSEQEAVIQGSAQETDVPEDGHMEPWRVADGYQLQVRFRNTPLLTVRTKVLAKGMEKLCRVYETVPAAPERHPELGEWLLQKGLVLQFVLREEKTLQQAEDFLKRQPYIKDWTVLQKPSPQTQSASVAGNSRRQGEEGAGSVQSLREDRANTGGGNGAKTIAVRQDKLNAHSDLVGEMATCYNMLSARINSLGIGDHELEKLLQTMDKLTDALHKSCMEMSMVPMEVVFFRTRLISREMSTNLGKQVKLDCQGGGVFVDKIVAEHLGDPLMHLVRNAMDHGIGTPERRRQAGKPEVGNLTIRAAAHRDDLVLTVEDDGAGIDRQRVLDAAEERGLLTKDRKAYSPQEIYDLVLLPGFSTRKKVSSYSGRGVGLDVVMETLRQLGGDLRISSKPGRGSTFTIIIPTTLSMTKALQVTLSGTTMVIPAANVRYVVSAASVQREAGDWETNSQGQQIGKLGEESYPVFAMGSQLSLEERARHETGCYVLVGRRKGDALIWVDSVEDFRTVVIKGLPEYLKYMEGIDAMYMGCAILDDGRIGMVLDMNKL